MKIPFLLLAAIPMVALTSCSTVKETAARVKENTLGSREPKLRLTKADPNRFLPEGTSAEKVAPKAAPAKLTNTDRRLLAKNTLPKKKASTPKPAPRKTTRKATKKTKTPVRAIAEAPIELPPLPAHTEDDGKGYQGILPSLDGSNEATFIDVDGKPLELPPMEMPDFDEEQSPEVST